MSILDEEMNTKYKTIVIDPPWPIEKLQRKVRPNQINMDYPMMSIEQIKSIKIANISEENSVCFLWTIQKYLPISFDILSAWGFKYQRTLTWDKSNGLCLFGFHHRSEFVLFGYKGKLDMYPRRKAIPTVFQAKSPYHSAKPDEFYQMISCFNEPRIDIFARKQREGFDVFGNEINCDSWLFDALGIQCQS
jgi:N6-adenosine-specific RNA methylase IME4